MSAHGNVGHTGSIDAIVAGLDGYVWVGYHKGRLERYTAGGMLAWWKVRLFPDAGCPDRGLLVSLAGRGAPERGRKI